jgi:hypothetical protein
MNRIFALLLFISTISHGLYAQSSPERLKNSFYLNAGLSVLSSGERKGPFPEPQYNIGLNYLYFEKWGIALNRLVYVQDDPNAPSDYVPFFSDWGAPPSELISYDLRAVRAFRSNNNIRKRFTTEIGPSIIKQRYYVYQKIASDYELFLSQRTTMGLALKLGFQYLFTRHTSIEFNIHANVNRYQPTIAGQVNLNIGKFIAKKKQMPNTLW